MNARMMKLGAAAQYCGLSVAAFERAVNAGTLPCPVKIDRHELWCMKALDKALDMPNGIIYRFVHGD